MKDYLNYDDWKNEVKKDIRRRDMIFLFFCLLMCLFAIVNIKTLIDHDFAILNYIMYFSFVLLAFMTTSIIYKLIYGIEKIEKNEYTKEEFVKYVKQIKEEQDRIYKNSEKYKNNNINKEFKKYNY
jgi:hypothetical protein